MANFVKRVLNPIFGSQLTEREGNEWLWDALGYSKTASGITVNEHTILTSSGYWAAVRLLSQTIASLPAPVHRPLERGKEKLPNHRLHAMWNEEMNPEMGAMVGREVLAAHAVTWGNCYAEVQRNGAMQPVALWPIAPDRVEVERAGKLGLGVETTGASDRRLIYMVRDDDGRRIPMEARDIFHVPGLGFNGIVGYSVAHMARESAGLSLAARRFGAEFFGNGSHASGVLETAQTFRNREQIEHLRKQWKSVYGGNSEGGSQQTVILESGMKFHQLTIPPDDAQFIDTRKFEITEASRWFLLPPHMLSDLERATFSNIEQESIRFIVHSIRPWLIRFEQEIVRKLRTQPDRQTGVKVEHNVEGLLRGDSAARANFYQVMIQAGIMSRNEAREKENMNPEEGLDEFLEPENMRPAGSFEESRGSTGEVEPDNRFAALVEQGARRAVNKASDQIARAFEKVRDGREEDFNRWRDEWIPKHAAYVAEAVQVSPEDATAYCRSIFEGTFDPASEKWKEGQRAALLELAMGVTA